MRVAILSAALALFAFAAVANEPAVSTVPHLPAEPGVAAEAPAAAPTPAPTPSFVVFLPEQVDAEWLWFFSTDGGQHIVQREVEKALINAGFDVIDLGSIQKLKEGGSIQDVTALPAAREAAQSANATYAIVGTATAVKGGQSTAYGVNVVRSSAEISAKILRVSDGKVVAVEDASAQTGGQAARAAGQAALKDAAAVVARKLAAAAKRVTQQP